MGSARLCQSAWKRAVLFRAGAFCQPLCAFAAKPSGQNCMGRCSYLRVFLSDDVPFNHLRGFWLLITQPTQRCPSDTQVSRGSRYWHTRSRSDRLRLKAECLFQMSAVELLTDRHLPPPRQFTNLVVLNTVACSGTYYTQRFQRQPGWQPSHARLICCQTAPLSLC